jgi:hypothetical protein
LNREGFLNEERVVVEAWQTNPMVIELARQVQNTQFFLRMVAIELRRIGERAPDIAAELRHVAKKLDAEADDLARDTEWGPSPAIRAET